MNGLRKERLDLLRRVNTLKVRLQAGHAQGRQHAVGRWAMRQRQRRAARACLLAECPRPAAHRRMVQANRAPRTEVEARLANAVAEATNAAAAAADAAARAATACIIQRPT